MKHKRGFLVLLLCMLLLTLDDSVGAQGPGPQEALGSAFTYQGRLLDGGSPVNGPRYLRFRLYNAEQDGGQVGDRELRELVQIDDGLFTVQLDFGAEAFNGEARFLEIAVGTTEIEGPYTILSPRQALTAAPYALSALTLPGVYPVNGNVGIGSSTPDARLHVSAGASQRGVLVSSPDDDGVVVYEAGRDGAYVRSAGRAGLYVHTAGEDGVYVNGAGDDGVYVGSVSNDGVKVYKAGTPSTTYPSDRRNGFEVEGAQGHGLYIGRSDAGAINVHSAGGNGLYVESAGRDGVHIRSAANLAGYFGGNVQVTGNLSKGGGSFKIDHPLDPENKYLSHSFVESPDMMNVYNGNVVLDGSGTAWVELPDWFEALNRDYRYQLTPIGGPGPGLYIAQEVQGNRFRIAGGAPGLKVSWQVTGIRHDPYAETHRILVVENKPAGERGTYLHPQAYDLPETRGLDYRDLQDAPGGEAQP